MHASLREPLRPRCRILRADCTPSCVNRCGLAVAPCWSRTSLRASRSLRLAPSCARPSARLRRLRYKGVSLHSSGGAVLGGRIRGVALIRALTRSGVVAARLKRRCGVRTWPSLATLTLDTVTTVAVGSHGALSGGRDTASRILRLSVPAHLRLCAPPLLLAALAGGGLLLAHPTMT